jgi:hypothetical protein
VYGGVFEHNHTLVSKGQAAAAYQAAADPSNDDSGLPCELGKLAAELRFQYQPAEVHHMIVELAEQRKIPVRWSKRHTEYVCRVDPADRLFDASGFCELVRRDAFDYRLQEDVGGKLSRAFWPLHSEDIVGTLGSAERVIIFDNTFNTSRCDLKLGVFTTIDSNGKTRMVACSLMRHEDMDSFEWVLQAFLAIFNVTPRVVLTDGDLWLARAVETVFPRAVHHLCVWHLARNVSKHIKGCFGAVRKKGAAQRGWHTWYSAFWRILLRTDSLTQANFDDEWEALRSLLSSTSSSSEEVVDMALTYLGGQEQEDGRDHTIYSLRRKWAYRYTWAEFTMGCNSTQRGEAVFKEIKARVRPGGLLVQLYRKLHSLDADMARVSENVFQTQTKMWSQQVSHGASHLPLSPP